jgi:hypothetical protein
MLHREYVVDNGGCPIKLFELKCDKCGDIMHCSWPRVDNENKNYCGDCAFKLGIINGFQYCSDFLYFAGDAAYFAEVVNGEIRNYSKREYKSKLKREKRGKVGKRNSPEYKNFRKIVFERDDYTCQNCNERGGTLNAHHIKSYKFNKSLRVDVDNGITLCIECHKKEHRGMNGGKEKRAVCSS